eukprot:TRINITY_DN863_c0_g1_i1.p1 TRINITY_DN863_c0_g1~~TRINITY_DN863_c0_g1_i1.p1  ORF type:complete len:459 (-),score=149.73 TRINITY_DN863_c0_g1_i1:15-1391(-)
MASDGVGVGNLFSKYKNETTSTQPAHEDIVKLTADKVLSQPIPWEGYRRAELIKDGELELIKKYDKKSEQVRKQLITEDGETYTDLFLQLLVKINKEETLQYLLTLIDQLLTDMPTLSIPLFLQLSKTTPGFPFDPLLRLLNRSNLDWFTYAKASSVTATLMSSATSLSDENVRVMCGWLTEQFRKPDEKDICNAIAALQKLGRKNQFREAFAAQDGLKLLGNILEAKSKSVQILYQTLYCLWLLSYSTTVAEQINNTTVIKNLVECLKRTGTHDKVIRMTLATLRNLMNVSSNNEQMIDAGIIKPLENLKNRNWADDDLTEDLDKLNDVLHQNIALLSTFDVFKKELQSGSLDWTPAHRSEKFWKENVHHFEDDNNKALILLKDILANSSDPTVLSVACFDAGEVARFHPRGRTLIQQVGLKVPLMKHMEDKNPEVRKQALLAVQKLMVTHWEFLSQ